MTYDISGLDLSALCAIYTKRGFLAVKFVEVKIDPKKALLTDGWWIILIPGAFLVVTLLAITGIGDYLRKELNKKESYL